MRLQTYSLRIRTADDHVHTPMSPLSLHPSTKLFVRRQQCVWCYFAVVLPLFVQCDPQEKDRNFNAHFLCISRASPNSFWKADQHTLQSCPSCDILFVLVHTFIVSLNQRYLNIWTSHQNSSSSGRGPSSNTFGAFPCVYSVCNQSSVASGSLLYLCALPVSANTGTQKEPHDHLNKQEKGPLYLEPFLPIKEIMTNIPPSRQVPTGHKPPCHISNRKYVQLSHIGY